MFESGAILLYLATKTGKLLPESIRGKLRRAAVADVPDGRRRPPMLGQAHHFRIYAPEKIEYAINR